MTDVLDTGMDLKIARIRQLVKATDLAERMGVSRATLHRIEGLAGGCVMAVDPTSRTSAPSRAVSGGRGRAQMARTTVLVAAVLEGQALCDEVMAGAQRMQTLAAVGDRVSLVNEAGRIGTRAVTARREFQRLASAIDR